MRRGAKLLLLLGALLLCAGAYALLTRWNAENARREQAAAAATAAPVPGFAQGELASIAYVYRGETVALARTDGAWRFADGADTPVDQQAAAAMAGALHALSATRAFPGGDDPAQYGLDAPLLTVTAADAEGRAHTYALGDANSVTYEYYLALDGENTVYLVDASLKNAFSLTKADLAAKDDIPLMTDIRRVAVTRAGETRALVYDAGAAAWLAVGANGAAARADAETAEKLAARVRALTWRKCVSCALTAAERASFGLDAPTLVTVEYAVTTASGETAGEALRAFAFEIGNAVNEYYYARLPEGAMAYLIDAALAEALLSLGGGDVSADG